MNKNETVYDIIGVGIGPFNLGMAAMCEKLPLNCLFFDQNKAFKWHPGMMLPNARLQVPFYADLVTVVDPTSKYTFLNYLKENKRLFRFAIHENNFILRSEYNDYCKWVADSLDCLRFNHKVIDVKREQITNTYIVTVINQNTDTAVEYCCKHLVVGIGTVPYFPECVASSLREPQTDILRSRSFGTDAGQNDKALAFHSSQYLHHKKHILPGKRVAIIGSGQSAAEIFQNLLTDSEKLKQLSWYTNSDRFYPMEYSKLTLEMASVDYINHFYSLKPHKKKETLARQNMLYKGINYSLINDIYDILYVKDLYANADNIIMQANSRLQEITTIDESMKLKFYHAELDEVFEVSADIVILATGYQRANPEFLNGIIDLINFDNEGLYNISQNYSIDANSTVFVQNAELHSHGFSAPDLGMGPYRNASILNSILGYEHYTLEQRVAFQTFGL